MKMRFTLIEMLVVIGIIGILAAMVMPALGAARASGQKTDCINNKKQLVTSMIAYSTDNDNAMIYRGYNGNQACTYADVLTGLSGETRAYLAAKLFMCSAAKNKFNTKAGQVGTNATGMLNAANAVTLSDDGSNTAGWLNNSTDKRYSTFGRFAKISDRNIVYYTDRMKAGGSNLLLFADTFAREDGGAVSYWNFTPDGASAGSYTDNDGSKSGNFYVTLIHSGMTVGAFADGHADGLDAGKLKDTGNVTSFDDEEFAKDKLSKN